MKNIFLILPLIILTSCGDRPSVPPPVTPARPPTVESTQPEPVTIPSPH